MAGWGINPPSPIRNQKSPADFLLDEAAVFMLIYGHGYENNGMEKRQAFSPGPNQAPGERILPGMLDVPAGGPGHQKHGCPRSPRHWGRRRLWNGPRRPAIQNARSRRLLATYGWSGTGLGGHPADGGQSIMGCGAFEKPGQEKYRERVPAVQQILQRGRFGFFGKTSAPTGRSAAAGRDSFPMEHRSSPTAMREHWLRPVMARPWE